MATAVTTDKNALAFLRQDRPMLIGGEWVSAASGQTFETYNPATDY